MSGTHSLQLFVRSAGGRMGYTMTHATRADIAAATFARIFEACESIGRIGPDESLEDVARRVAKAPALSMLTSATASRPPMRVEAASLSDAVEMVPSGASSAHATESAPDMLAVV